MKILFVVINFFSRFNFYDFVLLTKCRNSGKCIAQEFCIWKPGFSEKKCKTGKSNLLSQYALNVFFVVAVAIGGAVVTTMQGR